jgi:stalled ribosome rescue protein Dom34
MATQVGLWIDHRKAVIVVVEGDATSHIDSNVEKHVRYSGGGHANGSHESRPGTAEDTQDRHFEGQLNKYYDEVIERIRDAEAILICGPGEAKGELRTRLEQDGLGARIIGVETVDKMTERQVSAKVREYMARVALAPASGPHSRH